MASTIHDSQPVELFAYDINTYNIDWFTANLGGLQKCYTKAFRKPSGALRARSGPGGPKVAPQNLMGPTWGSLGPIRARGPQSGSTEPPGIHLEPSGPDPGHVATKWLHRASWDPSGAPWARSGPRGPKVAPQSLRPSGPQPARDSQTLHSCTPHHCWPHSGHTMQDNTQATRLQAKLRPHDCRPHAGHTQATRLIPGYTISQYPPPPVQCAPMQCVQQCAPCR